MGMFVVILSQNDVGKLLLMLSCANRKFDNLIHAKVPDPYMVGRW